MPHSETPPVPVVPETRDDELRRLIAGLWRERLFVLAPLVVAGVLAGAYVAAKPTVYTASAALVIRDPRADDQTQPAQRPDESLLPTQVLVLQSPPLRRAVLPQLGPQAKAITGYTVTQVPGTPAVRVDVTATDPQVAAQAANAFVATYRELRGQDVKQQATAQAAQLRNDITGLNDQLGQVQQEAEAEAARIAAIEGRIAAAAQNAKTTGVAVSAQALTPPSTATLDALQSRARSLQTRIDALTGQVDALEITIITPDRSTGGVYKALPPDEPSGPARLRTVVFALLLGLAVGLGLAALRLLFDDRLRSRGDVERAAPGVEVLAVVPPLAPWRRRRPELAVLDQPTGLRAEAYRLARTSLSFLTRDVACPVIVVTSTGVGEGKTTAAANLGVAMARAGQRVVLVESDLRRPALARALRVSRADLAGGLPAALRHGLSDGALADIPMDAAGSLRLLASPGIAPEAGELLNDEALPRLLDQLRGCADVVLLDAPPLLPVADALTLARYADGVLLVVRGRRVRRAGLGAALDRLAAVQAQLLGVLLLGARDSGQTRYHYTVDGRRRSREIVGTSATVAPVGVAAGSGGESEAPSRADRAPLGAAAVQLPPDSAPVSGPGSMHLHDSERPVTAGDPRERSLRPPAARLALPPRNVTVHPALKSPGFRGNSSATGPLDQR